MPISFDQQNQSGQDGRAELKSLLEKNLALTEELLTMTKSIKSYVTFQKIMSVIYFLIIVVPIVLSIIYLPPLLGNVLNQYQELMGGISGVNTLNKSGAGGKEDILKKIDAGQILKMLEKKQ